MCNIFYVKLVQCNGYLANTVNTDGLVFSTRASLATVLSMQWCVSSCLWVNAGTVSTLVGFRFPRKCFDTNGSLDYKNTPSIFLLIRLFDNCICIQLGNCVNNAKWLSTHWGQVTHICASKLTNIGSDNGLSPRHRQAIIWTNAGI